jgi:hypothetical protein
MSQKRKMKNKYGLTPKQDLTIKEAIKGVEEGKGLDLTAATEKYYNVSSKNSAAVISNKNMKRDNFRQALTDGLMEKKIIGADSKVEQRLSEGLDAKIQTKDGESEYDRRVILEYIKEINKVSGAYAPQKTETKRLNLNISGKELDDKIKQLQQELGGDRQ